MAPDRLIDFALAYAGAGYRVLPVRGKIPLTEHGSHDATTDPATLTAWWTKYPDAGIGMTLDNMVVVDVDPRNGGDVDTLPQPLPDTCYAKTGGGGWHYLYHARNGAKYRGTLGAGIDVKHGPGAYIVVEPSVHASGDKYVWLDETEPWGMKPTEAPEWLAKSDTPKTETREHGGPVDLLENIADGNALHDSTCALAAHYVGLGLGFAEIVNLLELVLLGSKAPRDERWRDRFGDIPKLVNSAIEKFRSPLQVASFYMPAPITLDEWTSARSTPDCIVRDYLFADVAVFISPGGMGKTTLKLFEAIHIALGLALYGLTIHKSGAVLIVTAEDGREILVARLRAIAQSMQLSDADIAIVMERVRISDTSGSGFKVTEVVADVVRPSEGVDRIIEVCQTFNPVLIIIDPAVSFGVGESRVNDAEQGLIEAARKLRRALNCCVQYVHHSGKGNARDRAVDQYAGRGGSAFADGARMVHVLQSLTPDEWRNETGTDLEDGESGLRLARPKMSYCAPVGDILIRRKGYHFVHVERVTANKQAKLESAADQVWQLLKFELNAGRYHSRNTIESIDTGLKRGEIRAALGWLVASQRVESRNTPNAGKGGKHTYLHPLGSPDETANQNERTLEKAETLASSKTVIGSPPPIGILLAANQPPQGDPFCSYASPNIDGEPMANLANQRRKVVEG